jgi:hypothetical protein
MNKHLEMLAFYMQQLKMYLEQIGELERNPQLSNSEKLSELAIIRTDIKKINDEIDSIKLEIKIARDININ